MAHTPIFLLGHLHETLPHCHILHPEELPRLRYQ